MLNPVLLEGKMQITSYRWTVNLFLALSIFALAEAGHAIGLQSLALAISVLWPATGLSLAAFLVFGAKTLPGIFLGNFCYNFSQLYSHFPVFWSSLATAMVIALGSTLQAYFGGAIIKRLSSSEFLKTVKDVFIFLIPAGALACMIASTIGVIALYFYQGLSPLMMVETWFTFWLGDSLGVFIVTPLLLVWGISKPTVPLKSHYFEAFIMLVCFGVLTFLTIFWHYLLGHLLLPLCLWTTYRFRMHGATLSIFLVSIAVIIPTSLGYGAFVANIAYDPLIILVSFLEILVATCLIFAAIINEREETWTLLQNYTANLQEQIKIHSQELKDISSEIFVKEKLTSLGMLAAGLGREIHVPLEEININSNASLDCLAVIQHLIKMEKEKIPPETSEAITNNFETLQNCLYQILQQNNRANRIVEIIQTQADRNEGARIEVKMVNLVILIQKCLSQISLDWISRHPSFRVAIEKRFHKAASMVPCIVEDLTHAFMNLFDNTFYSMYEKKQLEGPSYEPELMIQTIDHPEMIEILIRDNGLGVSRQRLEIFFEPFASTKPSGEATGIGLSLTHDIVIQEHRGELSVNSVEGEFLEIRVLLPKFRKMTQ